MTVFDHILFGRLGVYSTSLNTLISPRSTFRSSASRFCYKRLIWCVLSCIMMFFTVPACLFVKYYFTTHFAQDFNIKRDHQFSASVPLNVSIGKVILDFLRLQKFRSSHVYFHMILWSFAFCNTCLLNHCIARSYPYRIVHYIF